MSLHITIVGSTATSQYETHLGRTRTHTRAHTHICKASNKNYMNSFFFLDQIKKQVKFLQEQSRWKAAVKKLELRLKESWQLVLLWSLSSGKVRSRGVEAGRGITMPSPSDAQLSLRKPIQMWKKLQKRKKTPNPLGVQMLSEDLLVLGS